MKLETISKWVPLIIAAGYFVFLVATYTKVVSQLKLAAVAEVVESPKTEG